MQNIPPVEEFNREVFIWDPAEKRWDRGRRRDVVVLEDPIELVWTNTGVNTDVTPDEDKEIDVSYARRIAIQIDTVHPSNTSSDFDVNVEATLDGASWDTEPYAERNLGDAQRKTFLVEPGPAKIRLRGDNNAAATTGYVRALVYIME